MKGMVDHFRLIFRGLHSKLEVFVINFDSNEAAKKQVMNLYLSKEINRIFGDTKESLLCYLNLIAIMITAVNHFLLATHG